MFKSKANKKSAAPVPQDEWTMLTGAGKENMSSRRPNVDIPPQGVLVKETPWAPGSKPAGKTRPRTSSLPDIEAAPDRATDAIEKHAMNRAFERMLDELQIPTATRSKLATLDTPVKAAMLKSSQVLNIETPLNPPSLGGTSQLRKSRSSTSVGAERPDHARSKSLFGSDIPYDPRPPSSLGMTAGANLDEVLDRGSAPWMRDEYAGSASSLGRSSSPIPSASASSSLSANVRSGTREKAGKEKEKDLSPAAFAAMLSTTVCTSLEVERLKKLRLMLRNESAGWTELFIRARGYSALLTSLNDLLNVEWREEQRDDKILHELLRCLKALSTSSIGCFALRSSCPTPWGQLIILMYSDKKPGDLCTRQQMVDLMHILFELYPSASTVAQKRRSASVSVPVSGLPRVISNSTGPITTYPIPAPHSSLFSMIRSMLLVKAPPPAEQSTVPVEPHGFIESIHIPRIFKTYLQELSDVCRDYFWVFCHPQNTIWSLRETDIGRVEAPRAPGGMTGGVEYEAVQYMTSHLKFINLLAMAAAELNLPPSDELSAHRLHSDLFASGIERILVTTRKASTAYYPTLHLEIARYVSIASASQFELPWSLARYIGLPPSQVLKSNDVVGSRAAKITVTGSQSPSRTPPGSPSKKAVRAPPSGLQGGGPLPYIESVSPLK